MAEALPHREPRRPTAVPKPGATAPPTDAAGLRALIEATGTVPQTHPGAEALAVLEPLRTLLPRGVLERGTVVSIPGPATRGAGCAPDYLTLALIAGATAADAWCGVVGLPDLGIAATAGLGANLGRMLLLDEPADRWDQAALILAGAVDLIVLRPPTRPSAEQQRRITARLRSNARQRGAVLVVVGEWQGADLNLRTADAQWSGLGQGSGHLTGRLVSVAGAGRAARGGYATTRVWLPDSTGAVRELAAGEQLASPVDQPVRHVRPA